MSWQTLDGLWVLSEDRLMNATTTTAPLQNYRIVGVTEKVHQPSPDAPARPGGSCWHCGTAIRVCVIAQNTETGEKVTIGTTCAERIGLDPKGLREHLAARYAEQRAAARDERSAERRAQRAAAEAAATAEHGPHGTESRFTSGCRCDRCYDAAPHGVYRYMAHDCTCPVCVAAVLNDDDAMSIRYEHDSTVLVDLDTGSVVEDARYVSTRYGGRWRSDSLDVWLPYNPARRSTLASKGFTEAEVPTLVRRTPRSSRTLWVEEVRLASPVVDAWGTPIDRPTQED